MEVTPALTQIGKLFITYEDMSGVELVGNTTYQDFLKDPHGFWNKTVLPTDLKGAAQSSSIIQQERTGADQAFIHMDMSSIFQTYAQ